MPHTQASSAMDDERLRILQMVHDGILRPDEAERLLLALSASAPAQDEAPEITVLPAGSSEAMPDMTAFRRYWEYPFAVGLLLLGGAGLCVANTSSTLLAACGWICGLSAALLVVIAWLSQWSPWLHVRIHEHDGSRINFSLPLPFRLLSPLLALVRPLVQRFADRDTAENVDMALGMLAALGEAPPDQPLSVDIDDEDGDHIRVYIG